MLAASRPRTPFAILWRAFFAQFFSSETATSDVQLRQAIIGVLAFLVTPGILLAIEMYPRYQLACLSQLGSGTGAKSFRFSGGYC